MQHDLRVFFCLLGGFFRGVFCFLSYDVVCEKMVSMAKCYPPA